MSRVTSSGSSTTGSRLGDLGNGMCSVRKWRRSVLTKRKRSAETYWLTVDALSFLVWNRYAWLLSNLLRSELVGRLIKMLGKVTDDADVGFCGMMRVITALSLYHRADRPAKPYENLFSAKHACPN